MKFICPNCKEKLNKADDGRLICPSGHSFDRSKEGYYNLLLSLGGIHGDNKEMVVARRRFLSAGFYAFMAERLTKTVLEQTSTNGYVLDCGSGEGYYTNIVETALFSRDKTSNFYAFDISKDAVKISAKLNKRVNFAVASAYRQPFAEGCFDTVYNVFSPLAIDEVKRVLKPSGIFIMVIPDERHLFELKEQIYTTPYLNKLSETEIEGFELVSNEPVHYRMHLSTKEEISSLFKMTPYAYRTKREDRDKILKLETLEVSANFRILTYRRA